MQETRHHERGPIVVKQIADRIVDATLGVHRDLLFEYQAATHSSGAPAMQSPIQHRRGAPLRREASRRLISDGDAGQRAEFFLHHAAALVDLRRLVDVGGIGLRSRWDSGEVPLRQFNSFVHVHVAKDQQHGIRRGIVRLVKLLYIVECRRIEIVKIAVKIMRVGPVAVSDRRKIEPGKSAVGLIQHVDAYFFFHYIALVAQIFIVHLEGAHAVGLQPQHALERVRRHRFVIIRHVVVRRTVQHAAGRIDQLDVHHLAGVGRALKHHVLEQMRKAAPAPRLDSKSDVVIDPHSGHRGRPVRRNDNP